MALVPIRRKVLGSSEVPHWNEREWKTERVPTSAVVVQYQEGGRYFEGGFIIENGSERPSPFTFQEIQPERLLEECYSVSEEGVPRVERFPFSIFEREKEIWP